jgi:hypothetical protein
VSEIPSELRVQLTPEMRTWLSNNDGIKEDRFLFDVVKDFMREFNVDAICAGRLIGSWIVETL